MTEISRRALLSGSVLIAGAAGGAALGVGKSVHHRKALPPTPAPDGLVRLLDIERALLTSYALALGGGSAPAVLPSLRADVAAHINVLEAVLETYPGWRLARGADRRAAGASPAAQDGTSQPAPSAAPPGGPALTVQATAAASTAAGLCTGWPAGDSRSDAVVPLFGSIAACLQTHAQVLG